MIDLYSSNTPNGHKISILLEETNIPYRAQAVDIFHGEQFRKDFLSLNPNAQIPVIVDTETGETIFESGAILLFLAEKSGRFIPAVPKQRHEAIQWLFLEAASLGPVTKRLAHLKLFSHEPDSFTIEQGEREILRLFDILETHLQKRLFIADEYSIADIAHWVWVNIHETVGLTLAKHPQLKNWYERIAARPGVMRGLATSRQLRLNPGQKPIWVHLDRV